MNILQLLLKNVEAYSFCFYIFENIQSPIFKTGFLYFTQVYRYINGVLFKHE